MTPPTQKNRHMAIRIPEESIAMLNRIGQKRNQTANQVAKHAIIEWLDHYWAQSNEMITIPKENFAFLLKFLTPSQMNAYADHITTKIVTYFEFMAQQNHALDQLDKYIITMVKFLGTSSMNWFDQLDFEVNSPPFFVTGKHNLGEAWSNMFVMMNNQILAHRDFPFEIVKNKTISNEKIVYLEFQKKKDN